MSYQTAESLATQRAFNEGSDARIAGLTLAACPYPAGRISVYESWRRGWIDAAHFWGRESRCPVPPLPPVTTEESHA